MAVEPLKISFDYRDALDGTSRLSSAVKTAGKDITDFSSRATKDAQSTGQALKGIAETGGSAFTQLKQSADSQIGGVKDVLKSLDNATAAATGTQKAFSDSLAAGYGKVNEQIPDTIVHIAELVAELAIMSTGAGLASIPIFALGAQFGKLGILVAAGTTLFVAFAPSMAAVRSAMISLAEVTGITAAKKAILTAATKATTAAMDAMGKTIVATDGALAGMLGPLAAVVAILAVMVISWNWITDAVEKARTRMYEFSGQTDDLKTASSQLASAIDEMKIAFGSSIAVLGDSLVPIMRTATTLVKEMQPAMQGLGNIIYWVASAAGYLVEKIGGANAVVRTFISMIPGANAAGLIGAIGASLPSPAKNGYVGTNEAIPPRFDPYTGREELHGGYRPNDSDDFLGKGPKFDAPSSSGGGRSGGGDMVNKTDVDFMADYARELAALKDALDNGSVSAKEFDVRLNKLQDTTVKNLADPAAYAKDLDSWRAMWEAKLVIFKQMQQKVEAGAASMGESIAFGFQKAFKSFGTFSQQLSNFAEQGLTQFADGMAQAFTDFVTGAKSAGDAMRDFAKGFLTQIIQMINKMIIMALLQKVIGMVGGAGGGGPSIMGSYTGNYSGGMVGTGAAQSAPASAWLGAPHFSNGGMVGDGIPIIAHRGERVLNAQETQVYNSGMGGGNTTHISIYMSGDGGATHETSQGDDTRKARAMARAVKQAVQQELQIQKRQNGMLADR